ncbi:hypothetical protein ACFQ5D_16690 [Paenibacillus farraposensis]|uniref:Uncharacterized protein n=1 Tax=Paenibacillus farraposensis TaxID=2807095 RepID=A0ABW4DIB7_9BACL|nr:hypothetical protein [Paenibacillus farraposensis]
MSMSVGPAEHSLADEIWPLVTGQLRKDGRMEMSYLLQLLLLK